VLVTTQLDARHEQDQRVAGRIEEDGRACVWWSNKWDASKKDSHTMPAMEKELLAKALFSFDGADCCFTSALSGQRVESIFALALLAVRQAPAFRVTTSVG